MFEHPKLQQLQEKNPPLRLSIEASDLEFYGRDWTRRWVPAPLAIAFPTCVEEVQALVIWANQNHIALVPSGGRTGLSGGAVAANGEVVVSLEKMNKTLNFNAVDSTLTVQAGMPLQAVHQAAAEQGLLYPVDFAARGSCTIGGNIATNAGGIRVIRYGNTREWIAGLKVVTGTGEILELNNGLIKNSSGYDLRHLWIGSEGTLGIIVEATLRLTSPPPLSQVLLLGLSKFSDVMDAFIYFRKKVKLQAFEFFTDKALNYVIKQGAKSPFEETYPYYVVMEFDIPSGENTVDNDLAEAFEIGLIADGIMAQSTAQAAQLWHLREGISESLAPFLPYKNDVSVKISALPEFLHSTEELLLQHYPHFEVVWFGHIGDGNLHINILKPEATPQSEFIQQCEHVTHLLADILLKYQGSISAEHGIGLVKKPYLNCTRSLAEISLMQGVKQVFDPNKIINPNKMWD